MEKEMEREKNKGKQERRSMGGLNLHVGPSRSEEVN